MPKGAATFFCFPGPFRTYAKRVPLQLPYSNSKGNSFHRTDEFAKIRIEVRNRGLSEMMSDLNTETIQAVTKIFKLIGDPTRFLILHVLENRELNVNAIAEELDLEQSAVSHQLKKLREAKLVKSRRSGKNILYSQDDQHVYAILHLAVEHAEHGRDDGHKEVDTAATDKKEP